MSPRPSRGAPAKCGVEGQSRARRQSRCGHLRRPRIPRREPDSARRRRQVSRHASADAAVADSPNCSKLWSAGASGASSEMAALPPLGIAERLGTEGLRLRELARGEGDRKLLPLRRSAPFRRRDRTGLSGGTAGAAGLPAGPPDQRTGHAPGHPRARHRRTPPAPQTGNRRHARTLPAAAGPFAGYQGIPQAVATRSGSAPARRPRSCTCGWASTR